MSGTMTMPGGGLPQLPPQVLQAIMQRMQGQGAGAGIPPMPGMTGGAAPQLPPGMPAGPGGAQGGPPQVGNLAGQPPTAGLNGMPQAGTPPSGLMQGGGPSMPSAPPQGAPMSSMQGLPQGLPGGIPSGNPFAPPVGPGRSAPHPAMTAPQMAQRGRMGDSVISHLTPGEMTIPPQLQTPQLMASIRQAFAQAGIPPQQFVAGSPSSSINPQTGAEEHSLWSAILPVLGGIAGSFIPGLGTGVGAALGGAAGGAAGGALDHGSAAQIALGALGGGAGGYLSSGGASQLGGLLGLGNEASTAGATASTAGVGPGAAPAEGAVPGAVANTIAGAGGANGADSMVANAPTLMDRFKTGLGAGTGASLGAMLAPGQSSGNGLPPGFNTPMPPVNPNFNALRGSNQTSTPSFAGYNPYTSVTQGGYNFYPAA